MRAIVLAMVFLVHLTDFATVKFVDATPTGNHQGYVGQQAQSQCTCLNSNSNTNTMDTLQIGDRNEVGVNNRKETPIYPTEEMNLNPYLSHGQSSEFLHQHQSEYSQVSDTYDNNHNEVPDSQSDSNLVSNFLEEYNEFKNQLPNSEGYGDSTVLQNSDPDSANPTANPTYPSDFAYSEDTQQGYPMAVTESSINIEDNGRNKSEPEANYEIGSKTIKIKGKEDPKVIKQVIFIEPPQYIYKHELQIQEQRKVPRTVIYVFPPMVKHLYNVTDKRMHSKNMEKPSIYFLSKEFQESKNSNDFEVLNERHEKVDLDINKVLNTVPSPAIDTEHITSYPEQSNIREVQVDKNEAYFDHKSSANSEFPSYHVKSSRLSRTPSLDDVPLPPVRRYNYYSKLPKPEWAQKVITSEPVKQSRQMYSYDKPSTNPKPTQRTLLKKPIENKSSESNQYQMRNTAKPNFNVPTFNSYTNTNPYEMHFYKNVKNDIPSEPQSQIVENVTQENADSNTFEESNNFQTTQAGHNHNINLNSHPVPDSLAEYSTNSEILTQTNPLSKRNPEDFQIIPAILQNYYYIGPDGLTQQNA